MQRPELGTALRTATSRVGAFNLFLTAACTVLVAGCGTTSSLKTVEGADIRSIQQYSTVTVLDFGNKAGPKTDLTPQRIEELGRQFADKIAVELELTKAFTKVTRATTSQPGSLRVSGAITRCTEGNASLRLWIGMGAGSSYFDTLVEFADTDTAQKLGEIVVDKNSWGLGGGAAAAQTVERFMEGAAKKVAAQVAKAKADAMTGR